MDEAGEIADRNLERKRRRYLRGIGFIIEVNENAIFALAKVCDKVEW